MRGLEVLGVVGLAVMLAGPVGAALRLADGRPMVCVYYFGHWWEPWKSSDEAIRGDFARLRQMGVSTICVDHEWSQAIDGDWKWLDREHRLAKEAGLQIIPWLSLKTWSDLSDPGRMELAKQWYGVDLRLGERQDGKPGSIQIWDPETIKVGAAYAGDYLKRYRDQALLHLNWQGQSRPVVALSVELAWADGGFDEATTMLFVRWLRQRHGDIGKLNAAWGTTFGAFWEVNPRDTTVFDYANLQGGKAQHPQAVEDHIEFRSGLISDSLGMMAAVLRRTVPDVLILAELPYQLGSKHPHAEGYRIGYAANPSAARSADLLLLRCTGPLNEEEAQTLAAWRKQTGQPVILTYRTYSDWGTRARTAEDTAANAALYAGQAAELADGFGFYSWNEMVDTHAAPSPESEQGKPGALTVAQSDNAVALLGEMVRTYLKSNEGR